MDPVFYYGQEDYFERLNDLVSSFMPRCNGAGGVPAPVAADKVMVLEDNATMVDCTGALTLTFDASTLFDGWSCIVNALGGIVTITAPLINNTAGTTIPNGASALVSCNGSKYRIARMAGI